jgi:hypothetical protein
MFDLLCYFSNDSITCLCYKEAESASAQSTDFTGVETRAVLNWISFSGATMKI